MCSYLGILIEIDLMKVITGGNCGIDQVRVNICQIMSCMTEVCCFTLLQSFTLLHIFLSQVVCKSCWVLAAAFLER